MADGDLPEGLVYVDEFVTPREEHDLLATVEALPEPLAGVRERAAALIERDPEDLVQSLVSRYPEGVLSGKARWSWQHSIPATRELRYSITLRTLKRS